MRSHSPVVIGKPVKPVMDSPVLSWRVQALLGALLLYSASLCAQLATGLSFGSLTGPAYIVGLPLVGAFMALCVVFMEHRLQSPIRGIVAAWVVLTTAYFLVYVVACQLSPYDFKVEWAAYPFQAIIVGMFLACFWAARVHVGRGLASRKAKTRKAPPPTHENLN